MIVYELLNEKYPSLLVDSPYDNNAYILNRFSDYYIVIVYLSKESYNIAFVVSVTKDMLRSFDSIWIELMIDIGGEALSGKHNIRLGDIVIGCPIKKDGGVFCLSLHDFRYIVLYFSCLYEYFINLGYPHCIQIVVPCVPTCVYQNLE